MAFSTPTLLDIWTRLRNSMRAFLPGTDSWIEPNNLSVVGRSFTLALGSVYERVQYLYRQLFAASADGYHLEHRHAFEYGISRKAPAPAEGLISFTQTGGPATIPAGWVFTGPNNITYTSLTTAVPESSGVTSVVVRATTSGAKTNQLPNTPLLITQDAGYPSLPAGAIVGVDGLGGGADIETDEQLRKRVLHRKRQPPAGGSRSDYERWCLEVPGVTRVFVSAFKSSNPNEAHTPLTIYPMFDDTRAYGVPTAYDLLAVAQYVNDLRPVTSRVYFVAPTPVRVNVQIGNLETDTPALRAAIAANIAAMFEERVPVVTGENEFTLPQAWINEAIARSQRHVRHRLIDPTDDVSFFPGDLPVVGAVTFGS